MTWKEFYKTCRFRFYSTTEFDFSRTGRRGNTLCGNSLFFHRCIESKCPLFRLTPLAPDAAISTDGDDDGTSRRAAEPVS